MNRPYQRPPRPYSGFNYSPRPQFAPRRPFTHHGFRPPLHGAPAFEQNGSNKEYWCETCDRDFRSLRLLEEHKQQHQKCNIDGCQFIAHPKVITKHIQMQHSSGLYSKIANLNNPEELKKWREERKKKYPTRTNIERKAAEIKEKIIRGEKLGLKTERFPQRNNNSDLKRRHKNAFPNEIPLRDNKRNFNRKPNIAQNEKTGERSIPIRKRPPPKVTITVPEDNKKLKPFCGIQDLIMDSDEEVPVCSETNFLIDDDDSNYETPSKAEASSNATVCGALTNLMCNYATSDEDEPEDSNAKTAANTKIECNKIESKEKSTPPSVTVMQDLKEVEQCHASDEGEAPDEVKTVKINDNEPECDNSNRRKEELPQKVLMQAPRPNNRQGRQDNRRFRPKPQSTLLQKLLFKEMRQERNMVLQCVRHIVQNKYFDEK